MLHVHLPQIAYRGVSALKKHLILSIGNDLGRIHTVTAGNLPSHTIESAIYIIRRSSNFTWTQIAKAAQLKMALLPPRVSRDNKGCSTNPLGAAEKLIRGARSTVVAASTYSLIGPIRTWRLGGKELYKSRQSRAGQGS